MTGATAAFSYVSYDEQVVTIRVAQPLDALTVASIKLKSREHKITGRQMDEGKRDKQLQFYYDTTAKQLDQNSHQFLMAIAADSNKPVGYMSYFRDAKQNDTIVISELYSLPAEGCVDKIGSRLVGALVHQQRPATIVVQALDTAQQAYERFGFVVTGNVGLIEMKLYGAALTAWQQAALGHAPRNFLIPPQQ